MPIKYQFMLMQKLGFVHTARVRWSVAGTGRDGSGRAPHHRIDNSTTTPRPVTPRSTARDRSVHRHDDSHSMPLYYWSQFFSSSGWNLAFRTVSLPTSSIILSVDEAFQACTLCRESAVLAVVLIVTYLLLHQSCSDARADLLSPGFLFVFDSDEVGLSLSPRVHWSNKSQKD